jgi:hypothetical protein
VRAGSACDLITSSSFSWSARVSRFCEYWSSTTSSSATIDATAEGTSSQPSEKPKTSAGARRARLMARLLTVGSSCSSAARYPIGRRGNWIPGRSRPRRDDGMTVSLHFRAIGQGDVGGCRWM